MEQDKLLDKVSKKTNVSKEDILALASDLQTKDLNNEENIKEFVNKIAHMTNKQVSDQQMSKIIAVIQNNQVPQEFNVDEY
ncbi:MAG: stage VI sporulation protein F [Erysipelotrichaceae bacterium]|nr:stage VI sporulation protein F [Erysipelotrichaceae bacterium]